MSAKDIEKKFVGQPNWQNFVRQTFYFRFEYYWPIFTGNIYLKYKEENQEKTLCLRKVTSRKRN